MPRLPVLSAALGVVAVAAAVGAQPPREVPANGTFTNPLNLSYRFVVESLAVHRTAADPLIVPHGDDYFLFASRSGGYWHSPDFRTWTLVVPRGFSPEDYAPAVMVLNGRMYYTAHKMKALYATDDPKGGQWEKVADLESYADPAFFVDDDGRVYLYHGSGLNGTITAVELDPRAGFRVIGGPHVLFAANHVDHGWERSGPDHLGAVMAEGFRIGPYVEGSWMTKHDGTYYLQYAAPGTVWKTYGDGVYTSKSPTGGFTYQPYSPFSYRPGGFVGGAGHSGMFRDRAGNHWRVTTMIVSVAHKFERRLGIFPAGFDRDGVLRTNTYLGDLPQLLPGVARDPLNDNLAGWMLLSGGKAATASSSLDGHAPAQAFDEDIRSWWSARTANAGEWLRVDLGRPSRVTAVQVNFAEHGTRVRGRDSSTFHRYLLEGSLDGTTWRPLVDKRRNTTDVPHDYVQLDAPVEVRHVRLTNHHAAAGGTFSVRDLRVFGHSSVARPAVVAGVAVRRDPVDARSATITWRRSPGATGYVVRWGVAPDKLYGEFQVGDVDALTMNTLNVGVTYHFSVDAFNEGGVTRGTAVVKG
jgi:hypothetical protein